jgi:dTDP-4-amino-4,6-dideoxygalactose transaminase
LRRVQPPVVSPVSAAGFVAAVRASAGAAAGRAATTRLTERLAERFGARRVVLTDSGTSALVAALRASVPSGGTVALPGFACIDVSAAAERVGARVRLYDIDPHTLGPDLTSLEAALRRGADAVVVAHLFGIPVDMPAVARLAAAYGATVIEDAAQGAAGRLGGTPLGGFGPLATLSFGRGKGTTGGGGGALLAFAEFAEHPVVEAAARRNADPAGAGIKGLAATAAHWALGRPGLYALPTSLPFLKLGEMVYHPAGDPTSPSAASAALAAAALAGADAAACARAAVAERLALAVPAPARVVPPAGAAPGWLRYPVRLGQARAPEPALGILRSYPLTLEQHVPLRGLLHLGERAGPGAAELRDALLTLPTHHHVTQGDVARLVAWLGAA